MLQSVYSSVDELSRINKPFLTAPASKNNKSECDWRRSPRKQVNDILYIGYNSRALDIKLYTIFIDGEEVKLLHHSPNLLFPGATAKTGFDMMRQTEVWDQLLAERLQTKSSAKKRRESPVFVLQYKRTRLLMTLRRYCKLSNIKIRKEKRKKLWWRLGTEKYAAWTELNIRLRLVRNYRTGFCNGQQRYSNMKDCIKTRYESLPSVGIQA
jgi:hypothetical protein